MNISSISYYYFHPFDKNLPKVTGILRLIGTIVSGILSGGVVPLIMAAFYNKNFADLTHQPDRQTEKVKNVFENQVNQPTSEHLTGIFIPQETKENTNLRSEILKLFERDNDQANQLVNDIFEVIDNVIPSIKEDFNLFSRSYQKHIAKIVEIGGWNPLKSELDLNMAEPFESSISFEAFRTEVNEFIQQQVNIILQGMEIGEIEVEICGTNGWNSDVDIGLRAKDQSQSLTTEEMDVVKKLCELLTMRVIGKFPGIGLDTEWYVDLNFKADQIKTSEAERKFYTIDFGMAVNQAFKNLSTKGWKEYFETELQFAKNDNEKKLLKMIFSNIESISKERDKAGKRIMILEDNVNQSIVEGAGKNTLKRRKKAVRDSLSRSNTLKLQEVFEKIRDENGEKQYNSQLLSNYKYLLNLAKQCSSIELRISELSSLNLENVDQEELDNLYLEHDILFSLINASQPESLYTLSGINSTLFVKGGQKYQRILEQKIKEFGKKYPEESISVADLNSFVESQKEGVIDLAQLKFFIKSRVNSYRKQLEDEIEEIFKEAPQSNANQLLVATAERLAQFKHVLEKHDNIIEASKYLLRIAQGLDETLVIAKEKGVVIDSQLTRRVDKLLRLSRRLEKCKRKFAINDYVARTLLKDQLSNNDTDTEKLEGELKSIFKHYHQKYKGRVYLEREKLRHLTKKLNIALGNETIENNGKTITSNVTPFEADVDNILRAFVGYSRQEHEELRLYHDAASELTLEHHQALIETVEEDIHKLCIDVRHLMQNNHLAYELSEEAVELFSSVPDSSSSDSEN